MENFLPTKLLILEAGSFKSFNAPDEKINKIKNPGSPTIWGGKEEVKEGFLDYKVVVFKGWSYPRGTRLMKMLLEA